MGQWRLSKQAYKPYLLYKSYSTTISSVLYVRNRRKFEYLYIIFYGLICGLIGDQLTLSKQGYKQNLTKAMFCMLEIAENMKIAISNFMMLSLANEQFQSKDTILFDLQVLKYHF